MFFACCDWEDAREADSCPASIDDSIGDDFSDLGEDSNVSGSKRKTKLAQKCVDTEED